MLNVKYIRTIVTENYEYSVTIATVELAGFDLL